MKTIHAKVYGDEPDVEALVDDEDYEYLSQFTWRIVGKGYVARQTSRRENGKRRYGCVYMHREILSAPAGQVVDHVNRNTLDNRRTNLRLCSQRQNLYNTAGYTKLSRSGRPVVSGHKGVSRADSRRNPWSARIRVDGREKHLGVFRTEEEAARAYDAAAAQLHGDFARLNGV